MDFIDKIQDVILTEKLDKSEGFIVSYKMPFSEWFDTHKDSFDEDMTKAIAKDVYNKLCALAEDI